MTWILKHFTLYIFQQRIRQKQIHIPHDVIFNPFAYSPFLIHILLLYLQLHWVFTYKKSLYRNINSVERLRFLSATMSLMEITKTISMTRTRVKITISFIRILMLRRSTVWNGTKMVRSFIDFDQSRSHHETFIKVSISCDDLKSENWLTIHKFLHERERLRSPRSGWNQSWCEYEKLMMRVDNLLIIDKQNSSSGISMNILSSKITFQRQKVLKLRNKEIFDISKIFTFHRSKQMSQLLIKKFYHKDFFFSVDKNSNENQSLIQLYHMNEFGRQRNNKKNYKRKGNTKLLRFLVSFSGILPLLFLSDKNCSSRLGPSE